MERFKKIGELCKLHYEKIALTIALLLLGGAVWILAGKKQEEQERINQVDVDYEKRKVPPVPPVDISSYQAALKNAQNPPALVFAGTHNLFNPVRWQRRPDGSLLKVVSGKEVGPYALIATRFSALNFMVSFERVAGTGYEVGFTSEAATNSSARAKARRFVTLNSKVEKLPANPGTFLLKEVKGPAEDPAELLFEHVESGGKITVGKDKPYSRADGYAVDLKYPPENKNFPALRVGAVIRFDSEDYTVVSISSDEAILSGRNERKYHLTLSGAR